MTAAESASRRAAGVASRILFGVCLVAAGWCFYYDLDDHPPWLDYDSAALGIFVNSISYREHYAAVFRDSPKAHNVFRASWAASFLPAMAPLSAVQRALDVPPDRVDVILKAAGIVFGLLGTACAALLARSGGRSLLDALFLFGVVASVPPFLLYVRTAVPNFLYSYFMFWLAVLCIDRYTRTAGPRWIWTLGVVLGLYAMVPYVPLAVLPVVGLLLATWRRAVRRSLRDVHLYGAGALSIVLFVALRLVVGTSFEGTYSAWQEKTLPYLSSRAGHAISLDHLDPALLPEKLAKLAHQHFWFGRDQLGDRTRSDALWTVPAPQLPWVLLLVAAAIGMVRSRRDGDSSAAPFAAVLVATYGVALTVSFPEGRYIIPAIPALAFFAMQGMRELVRPANARTLAYSAMLAWMAWASFALVSGPYRDWIIGQWQDRAGMRETIALIRRDVGADYGASRELRLSWPQMNHEVWLYLQMLTNLRATVYEIDKEQRGLGPRFAAVRSDDAARLEDLAARGFRKLGTVTDPVIGRAIEVFLQEDGSRER